MKLYNFNRLINKYSVPFHFLMKSEGHFESGKWVEGEAIKRQAHGAIIPMPESKIYHSGGTYTAKDRQLIMTKPLDRALEGVQVIYKNNLYNVEQETDYTDYADIAVYTMKWVSVFDQ